MADQHVHAIHRIPDCEIVSLCDRELLMAKQLGERFGISECFCDLAELLERSSPDVVHITTPPQSHFVLARQCLDARSHVYLEKPFALTAEEVNSLIEIANRRELKITAGHNYQFTLEMREMRRLVEQGFLGGRPVHLQSFWSYNLGDSLYAGSFLGSRTHWVRQLPGQLFHNIISHGIAKLAEFLDDELTEVVATAGQSPELRRLAGEEVLDELRVLIRDKSGTTALFCFSTQMKGLNRLCVYGPAASLVADIITGSLIRSKTDAYKSYLTYFVPPAKNAWEHLRNLGSNVMNFARQRLYQDFGMKELIERFYNSIRTASEPPIPYREIVLTARIMDEIFAQVYPAQRRGVGTSLNNAEDNIGQKTEDRRLRTADGGAGTSLSSVISPRSSDE